MPKQNRLPHPCHLLLAGLLLAAPAVLAQQKPPAQPAKTHAELVQECMNDVMRGLKAGQVLTTHQRMQSEMQCKAYADSKK